MRRFWKNGKLLIKYISVIIQGTMQYKLSFALMLIGRFILAFNGFVAIFFLFSGITQIKGYTYSDILLCFSIMQMSFAIAECFGTGFKVFSGIIKRGEFDRMMLRPCSLILQVVGTRFDLGRIGPIATAVITLIVGIKNSSVSWGAARILTLIAMIAGGAVLFVGLFMLGACFCFFSIEDGGILNVLTYGAKEHGKYPIDIYGKGLLKFCTYVIPYTLAQYYPLHFLLGKTARWQYSLFPFGTLIFLSFCYLLWRWGVRNYKSCGN